jgi:hypothetical protein
MQVTIFNLAPNQPFGNNAQHDPYAAFKEASPSVPSLFSSPRLSTNNTGSSSITPLSMNSSFAGGPGINQGMSNMTISANNSMMGMNVNPGMVGAMRPLNQANPQMVMNNMNMMQNGMNTQMGMNNMQNGMSSQMGMNNMNNMQNGMNSQMGMNNMQNAMNSQMGMNNLQNSQMGMTNMQNAMNPMLMHNGMVPSNQQMYAQNGMMQMPGQGMQQRPGQQSQYPGQFQNQQGFNGYRQN